MFSLTSSNSFYLYRYPTDMRKSFDGLSCLVQSEMKRNPLSGEVFLFINKRKDRIKLLKWEPGGFTLFYKRLEEGTLELPKIPSEDKSITLSWTQIILMIEGIMIEKYRLKNRYKRA
jgi:transposase